MKRKFSIIILNTLSDKKIKSLGDKCLIKLDQHRCLIDYQIQLFNKIFNKPEIIIIGGLDNKRLKKYIDTNFSNINIKYIQHNIDTSTNIGTSIKYAINSITNHNCLIINSSLLLHKSISQIIFKNLISSFILVQENIKGNIGYISSNSNKIMNCYYDLPNSVIDCLYIASKDFDIFSKICQSDIDRYYLFEVINKCIESNISFKPLPVLSKMVTIIDSIDSIQNLRNNLCII